jgi:antitoxin ParD1/3/4
MTVSLSADLQRVVEEKVRAGDYASADDAVNSLLSFVVQQDELSDPATDELRTKIAVGVAEADRGELSEWDSDEVWAEVERQYAERQGKRAG